VVFRIGFECDFTVAVGAFEVETKDLDPEVGLFVAYLHSHIEFSTDVEIVRACVATQTHRQHVTHHHQLVLASSTLHNALVVEVFGEIFNENLSLSHIYIL
jgi:hypothetical protein